MQLSRQLVQLSYPEADVEYAPADSPASTGRWQVRALHGGDDKILGRGITPQEAWDDAANELNSAASNAD